VLSKEGKPIKLSKVPKEMEDIKIEKDGVIKYLDKTDLKLHEVETLSVVSSEGIIMENPDVKQGYVEESNVAMHQELFSLVPVRRNFEANRQLFLIQSDSLARTIQELGRTT
jgi:flagellar basal body rod protein FlgG